jgi:hypothetical protein
LNQKRKILEDYNKVSEDPESEIKKMKREVVGKRENHLSLD